MMNKEVKSSSQEPDVFDSSAPPITIGTRVVTLSVVIIPFVGIIAAIILLWNRGFGGVELGLLMTMYVLTVLGITVGYHRLFTHRSFETHPVVQSILAICGSMALQGSLLKWVALHRKHHHHSDKVGDPHSPYNRKGNGALEVLRGFWHAHIGWFFDQDSPDLYHYVKDLKKSRLLSRISTLFPLWVALGLIIPAILGGLLTMSWMGVVLGFVWGGLVRIFLVHHVTWSINSICHIWGKRPFKTTDYSRNNLIFGILGLGEGWHNNHHAFPVSARHGLKWWQIDVSYYVIRLLAACRLAKNVRLPQYQVS